MDSVVSLNAFINPFADLSRTSTSGQARLTTERTASRATDALTSNGVLGALTGLNDSDTDPMVGAAYNGLPEYDANSDASNEAP